MAQTNVKFSKNVATEIIHVVKFLSDVFDQQQLTQIETATEQFIKVVQVAFSNHPLTLLSLLNLQEKRLNYRQNILLKIAISSFLITEQNHCEVQSQKALMKTCLLLLLPVHRHLTIVKDNPKKQQAIIRHLRNAPKQAFSLLKSASEIPQTCLRLLTLLGGINKRFQSDSKNQGMIALSLELSFLQLPFTANKPLCFEQALQTVVLAKPLMFTSNRFSVWYSELIAGLNSTLLSFTPAANQHKDIIFVMAQYHTNDEIVALHYGKNLTPSVTQVEYLKDTNNLRFYPQQKVDCLLLLSFLNIQQEHFIKAINPRHIKQYTRKSASLLPSQEFQKLSPLLLNAKTSHIERTLAQTAVANDILHYAGQLTRNKTSPTELKHALAIMGVERLSPVLAICELSRAQQQNYGFNNFDIVNQLEFYSYSSKTIAKHFSSQLPEVSELLSLLLFTSLLKIPKAHYVISSRNYINKNNDSDVFSACGLNDVSSWRKVAMTLCKEWQIDKKQLSYLTAFFDCKQNKTTLNNLPKGNVEFILNHYLTGVLFALFIGLQPSHTEIERINDLYKSYLNKTFDFDSLLQEVTAQHLPVTYLY